MIMRSRQEQDQVAWETIHASKTHPGPPAGLAVSLRPANYRELGELIASSGDQEHAWSEFLHEFFRYKTASFFAEPSPKILSAEWQALLAGVAEWLSIEFGLPLPQWINEAQYYLPEIWDSLEYWLPDAEPYREERMARTHEVFLKRNVIFETRSLITL
jgi:hypothetical protein